MRKSIVTCFVVLTLVVGTFSAWAAGVQGEVTGPAEISFAMAQQLWGGATDPDLQKAFVELMEQETNTKIEMIAPPHSDYSQKLNVILASGDIPDLFNIYGAMSNVPVYAQRGYLRELDGLLAKRDSLNKIYGDIYPMLSIIDGKNYAVPDGRNNLILMFMRKDMLESVGLGVPTSIDEFYTALKALKGKGVIPLSNAKFMSYFRFIFSSFGAYDDVIVDAGGNYADGFSTQQMGDALQFVAKLYSEGLLDEEFVTNGTGTMREKLYSGQSATSVYWDIFYTTYQIETQKNDPKAEIVPIYRLAGPGGPGYTTDWGIDGAYGISAKSMYPEKALDIVEWFNTSEGYVAHFSGVEGTHYTIDSSGKAVPTAKAADSGYGINVFNYVKAPFPLDLPFSFGAEAEALAEKQFQVYQNGLDAIGPYYAVPAGKSDIYDRQRTAMKDKRQELATQVIIGSLTLEQGLVEWKAFWKSIDGDAMLAELNS